MRAEWRLAYTWRDYWKANQNYNSEWIQESKQEALFGNQPITYFLEWVEESWAEPLAILTVWETLEKLVDHFKSAVEGRVCHVSSLFLFDQWIDQQSAALKMDAHVDSIQNPDWENILINTHHVVTQGTL